MAQTKGVIFAGGVFPNPLLNREGNAGVAITPGQVVYFDDSGLMQPAPNGSESGILYVANEDYLKANGVDTPIAVGETAVGIHPLPGMFLNVLAAAGTYSKGDPVTVSNGQVTAGTTDVFAYVEEDFSITATAGELIRVVFK